METDIDIKTVETHLFTCMCPSSSGCLLAKRPLICGFVLKQTDQKDLYFSSRSGSVVVWEREGRSHRTARVHFGCRSLLARLFRRIRILVRARLQCSWSGYKHSLEYL